MSFRSHPFIRPCAHAAQPARILHPLYALSDASRTLPAFFRHVFAQLLRPFSSRLASALLRFRHIWLDAMAREAAPPSIP